MEKLRPAIAALGLVSSLACAGAAPAEPTGAGPQVAFRRAPPVPAAAGPRAARAALSALGTPYRYGGASPRGFDCSGLVVYSYARAGRPGLPHSAEALEQRSRSVGLDQLEPGDLLFFHLSGKKTSHVAIYVGGRSFVHAPSGGRRVERVSFDHVYWGPRVRRAGRLVH